MVVKFASGPHRSIKFWQPVDHFHAMEVFVHVNEKQNSGNRTRLRSVGDQLVRFLFSSVCSCYCIIHVVLRDKVKVIPVCGYLARITCSCSTPPYIGTTEYCYSLLYLFPCLLTSFTQLQKERRWPGKTAWKWQFGSGLSTRSVKVKPSLVYWLELNLDVMHW